MADELPGANDPEKPRRFASATRAFIYNFRTPLFACFGALLSIVAAALVWVFLENNPPLDTYYGSSAYQPTITVIAIILGGCGVVFFLLWAATRSFASEAENTRRRVENTNSPDIYVNGGTAHIHVQDVESRAAGTTSVLDQDVQESMLTQIYSHGLAQAKISFFVSIVFGTLGSVVLLTGVGLAIVHAGGNGNRYAAIVTQTSGAVIDLLGGVFFLQSNRTRRDMGQQGVMLRDDSRFDRRLRAASVLSDNIANDVLKDEVRAQMALRLVDAELRDMTATADASVDDDASARESGAEDAATAPENR